jgi:FkbM family methyltransferase
MNRLMQLGLLKAYKGVKNAGLLESGLGRGLFEASYFLHKEYLEAGAIAHLQDFVAADSWMFDVGANIGFFTKKFATWCRGEGRVVAVEPEAKNFERLLHYLDKWSLSSKVISLQSLISDESGELLLELNPHHPGDHKIGSIGMATPATTLDELMQSHAHPPVSLIKIDTQGAEMKVLKGAQKLLADQKPALFIEIDDDALQGFATSAHLVHQWLKALDYLPCTHKNKSYHQVSDEKFQHQVASTPYFDMLFIHPKTHSEIISRRPR